MSGFFTAEKEFSQLITGVLSSRLSIVDAFSCEEKIWYVSGAQTEGRLVMTGKVSCFHTSILKISINGH
jgi:hypothetical protein